MKTRTRTVVILATIVVLILIGGFLGLSKLRADRKVGRCQDLASLYAALPGVPLDGADHHVLVARYQAVDDQAKAAGCDMAGFTVNVSP